MFIDRRSLITTGLAGMAVSGSWAARPRPFFAAHAAPLGIQLYTVAEQAQADLDGTLGRLAGFGYRQVEMAGPFGRGRDEWRALLRKHGLVARSAHLAVDGPGPNLTDHIGEVAAFYRPLGVTTVVMSFPPPLPGVAQAPGEPFPDYAARLAAAMTAEHWIELAAGLNARAERLRRDGLRLAYHNHNIEFLPRGTTNGLELLLKHTRPGLVAFEMDAGWVSAGGHDPVAWLNRWPNRFRLMHVKDLTAASPVDYGCHMEPADIGRGRLDWARILPAAWRAGARDFLVEQEPPFPRGRLAAAAANAAYLTGLRA